MAKVTGSNPVEPILLRVLDFSALLRGGWHQDLGPLPGEFGTRSPSRYLRVATHGGNDEDGTSEFRFV
jgi:hypothetical protein